MGEQYFHILPAHSKPSSSNIKNDMPYARPNIDKSKLHFQITPTKHSYQLSDRLSLHLSLENVPQPILMTYERDSLVGFRFFLLGNKPYQFEETVTSLFIPQCTLAFHRFLQNDLRIVYHKIHVNDIRHRLRIRLRKKIELIEKKSETGKGKSKIRLNIDVSDHQGKPVRAEVIVTIMPDSPKNFSWNPDIYQYYYSNLYNYVPTFNSLHFQFISGQEYSYLQLPQRRQKIQIVRKISNNNFTFEPTLAKISTRNILSNGHGKCFVYLPAIQSPYKIRVVAIDKKTRVGNQTYCSAHSCIK